MRDVIRVVNVVPVLKLGAVKENTEIVKKSVVEASAGYSPNFVLFPELTLTGYTCGDLFFQETLLDEVKNGIVELLGIADPKFTSRVVLIGAPLKIKGQLYNCAIVMHRQKILGIIPKTYLPNYNEFYEKRWFSSASDLIVNHITMHELIRDISSENYAIPIGNDIIFSIDDVSFGVEICEDLWSPLPPSTMLALNGAELILNLSASNEIVAKRQYRENLIKQQSARNICAYAYCSAGTTESSTDLIFSGASMIAENGSIIAKEENPLNTNTIVAADIDLGKIKADRIKNKTFKDTAALYAPVKPCREVISVPKDDFSSSGVLLKVKQTPFVPMDKAHRLERCMEIFKMQVEGLARRVVMTGGKLVIGVSGGLDSTLALLVAVEVMNRMGRSPKDVIGITMPGFGTTDLTKTNAYKLMETLGITIKEIPIKDACIQHFKDIDHDVNVHNVTYENVQARERTQILMDYANKVGGFVVGTGDLSELALGWCTYNGDHMSMYAVNTSIPKTLVKWMVESIAKSNVFEGCEQVLLDIADTPISPELLPPSEDGEIEQKTEDTIGPYILHDFFLYYVLRFGFSPSKIFELAKLAFICPYLARKEKSPFNEIEILKWMKVFYKRFFSQQFKRSCLPDGVKVGSVCLSPRGDWRMPSDAFADIWLKEVEELEKCYN